MITTKPTRIIGLFFFFTFLFSAIASAHSPDQSYLYFRIKKDGIDGRIELTAKDINKAIGTNIPDDMDDSIIQPILPQVYAYLKERTAFSANGKSYTLKFTEPEVLDLEEMEDFTRFNFTLEGVDEVPDKLDVKYDVLFDQDPKHKGMLIQEYNWKAGILNNEAMMSNIFEPGKTQQSLDLTDGSIWKGFWLLIRLGVWHIWIGLDHILFIVALILPAVVRRRKNEVSGKYEWVPVESFKDSFFYILKIITFFTIAHSVTLAIAALGVFDSLSSRIVETIIAFSIGLAALHNITPIFKAKEWIIALAFGLFHGFGFASVFGEKGLEGDYLVPSLLGFNLGVEIGQVLIICMVFPILFLLRKLKIYPYIIIIGSAILILISLYWCIERGFEVDLPLGSWVNKILG